MQYGIDELTIEKIGEVFEQDNKIEEVLIYGSRVKGKPKFTSKIELALKGKNLGIDDLLRLELALHNLKLDYKCTLCILNLVANIELKDHILAFGKMFYSSAIVNAKSFI